MKLTTEESYTVAHALDAAMHQYREDIKEARAAGGAERVAESFEQLIAKCQKIRERIAI